MAGELTTTNYGWTKPTVGASTDAWGGYINADLDGIDSVVHGVQTSIRGDNRIINGDMRIDQRNNGASGTANGYTVDRWLYSANQTGKGTWGRSSPGPSGFPYYLFFNSSSAYASVAGDNFGFFQRIEADMASDFAWGSSSAQPVTLSFWANSSQTGTFGGAIQNQPSPATRSYPFSFSLTANVWTKIVITIPGDTAGTWVMSGNAAGILLVFDLGSGSTLRGPANAWASANYWGVTGAVSLVATNGAGIEITGVKLEVGSVATPFNRQSPAKTMADCQRYYQKLGGVTSNDFLVQGYVGAASQAICQVNSYYIMRAAPSATVIGSFSGANVTGVTIVPGLQTMSVQITGTAAGFVSWGNTSTSAYITLTAEL
jgi:hypothetical protein